MMFETRRSDQRLRQSQLVLVLAGFLLGFALLPGTNPAAAQEPTPMPAVKVFHSPDGSDPRPMFPPGCIGGAGVGGGGLVASTGNNGAALIEVDSATGAGTQIGPLNAFGPVTDLDFRSDGVLFGSTGGGTSHLITIDALGTESLVGTHTFGALTGLEFVGETLYGSFIPAGGGSALSDLVIVDQATAALTPVGATGSGPIGGLAFDAGAGVLYGVTSGKSGGDLIAIDLATGAGTLVGSTGVGDISALEFGPNGFLYGGLGGNSSAPGSLITIDPLDGAATMVGASGFPRLSGLSRSVDCVIDGAPGGELNLWIDGGDATDAKVVCKLGTGGSGGAQLCGAALLFEIQGPGFFTFFERDVGMTTLIHNPDCVDAGSEQCELPPDTKQLRMIFRRGDPTGTPPPAAIPRALGTLTVDSSNTTLAPFAPTTVSVSGSAAGANLQLRSIAAGSVAETIALPEPGATVSLTSGLLGLALLCRFRRTRPCSKHGHRGET